MKKVLLITDLKNNNVIFLFNSQIFLLGLNRFYLSLSHPVIPDHVHRKHLFFDF